MGNEFLMSMGTRIRNRRIDLGMTQDDLCKLVGFSSRSSIAKVELGSRDLPHDKIVSIAKALGTTPAYIMGWNEPEVEEFNIVTDKSNTQVEIENRLSNLTEGQLKAILSLVKEMEG